MSLRVTDNFLARSLYGSMDRSLRNLARAQLQAGSLHRLTSFADDPAAVAAISRYRDLVTANGQYLRNVTRARAIVDATDGSLQTVSDLLTEARALIEYQLNPLSTAESRARAADEVDGLVQRMVLALNVQVEGDYVFGGRRTDVPAFAISDGQAQYQGDDGAIQVRIGPHSLMEVNVPGSDLLGSGTASLVGDVAMTPMLRTTTLLADLNRGAGWQEGSIRIDDGLGNSFVVNLTGAATVGDVLTRIEVAGGGALIPGLHVNGSSLQIIGTGPLTVSEVGGTTAASLGILGTSESGLLVGQDVRTAPTDTTRLSRIPTLSGKLPLGTIVIESGGTATSVDLSSAVTIGDLRALVQAAVPDLDLTIQGECLRLVSGTSTPFTVRSAGGGTTAADLGIAGTGSPSRLFGVMADLRAALLADDTDGIRQALAEMEPVASLLGTQMVQVGGKQQTLDWADGVLRQRDERLQSSLSQERDVDVARLATELSQAESAYQATLLVASRLFQTNLMQYLR